MANPSQKQYESFQIYKPSFPASSPGIAHVQISNPSKLNALSPTAFSELPPLFSLLSADPAVLVVVLSGSGDRAFSAGLDLSTAAAPDSILSFAQSTVPLAFRQQKEQAARPGRADPARVALRMKDHIEDLQRSVSAIANCRKPVIAAIHGHCLGAGLDLATCADIRLASPSSTFGVREVHLGLAADLGVLTRLPKIVGNQSWVKDVCFTGRIFGAEEAKREGLVSWVGKSAAGQGDYTSDVDKEGRRPREKAEVLDKAFKLANEIMGNSPIAVQGTKVLLDYSNDHSVAEGLDYTAVWNSAMLQTADISDSIAASRTKKRPTFSKL